MTKITLNNYEAYYLDYLEGTLPTEDVAALLLFLEQHPQLKVDFDSIENLVLSEDSISYSDKLELKNFSRAEQLMIGSIEGINSKEETAELQELVSKSTVLSKNLAQFQKTKLQRETISYPNKNNLKRRKGIVVYLYPIVSVAATIAILITVFNFSFTIDSSLSNALIVADRKFEMNPIKIDDTILTKDSAMNNNTIAESNISVVPQKTIKIKPLNELTPSTVLLNNDKDSLLSQDVDSKEMKIENKNVIDLDTSDQSIFDTAPNDIIAGTTSMSPDEITFRQFLSNKIRKKVFKEDEPTFDNLTGDEIIDNITSGLSNVTKKEVVYVQSSADQKDVVSFSIGKFEFYRSKTK